MNLGQVMTRASANCLGLDTTILQNLQAFVQSAVLQLQFIHNFQIMKAEVPYVTSSTPSSSPQSHILGVIPAGGAGVAPAWKEPRGTPYFLRQDGTARHLDWQPTREYMYRKWAPYDVNQVGNRGISCWEPANLATLFDSSGATSATTEADTHPPDYNLTTMNIEVYPFPDGNSDWSDGNYRVQIPYWGYVPPLLAAADSNWFTVNAIEFLVSCTTALCFEAAMDPKGASYWNSRAWGPKWDGVNFKMLGGWARAVINHDRKVIGNPTQALVSRRDVNAMRDQWRTI